MPAHARKTDCSDSNHSQASYIDYQKGDSWGKVDLTNDPSFSNSHFKTNGSNTAVAIVDSRVIFLTNHHIINAQGFVQEVHNNKLEDTLDGNLAFTANVCGTSYYQYYFKRDPIETCKESKTSFHINNPENSLIILLEKKYEELNQKISKKFPGYFEKYKDFIDNFPTYVHFIRIDPVNWSSLMEEARTKNEGEALTGLSSQQKTEFLSMIKSIDKLKKMRASARIPLICDKALWDSTYLDIALIAYKIDINEVDRIFPPDTLISRDAILNAMKTSIRPKTLDFTSQPSKFTRIVTAGFGPNQFDQEDLLTGDISDECVLLGDGKNFFEHEYVSQEFQRSFIYRDTYQKRISVPLGCDVGPQDSGSPIMPYDDFNRIIGVVHSSTVSPSKPSFSSLLDMAENNFTALRHMPKSNGSLIYQLDLKIRDDLESIHDPDTSYLINETLNQSITNN